MYRFPLHRRPPQLNLNREWTRMDAKTTANGSASARPTARQAAIQKPTADERRWDADKYSAVHRLLNKLRQRAVMDRWISGLISKTGHWIYQCRQPIVVGAINLSFVICHLSFAGATGDPVSQLRSEIDQVLVIAYSGQSNETIVDRVRPLLEKDFSFELVTRQAIGPGWRQFTPGDQQKVTDLFSRLVIRIYAARVVGTQRPKITYGSPVELAPDRREIPSRVTTSTSSDPVAVVYRLIKLPVGWRIYDVLIEGVSFVANYRAQFDEIIQRGGASAVIRTLETKLAAPGDSHS